jgi:hypothetical protein
MPNTLRRLPLCTGMNKILLHIIPNSSVSVLHEVALFTIKLTPRLIKLHYVKACGGMKDVDYKIKLP